MMDVWMVLTVLLVVVVGTVFAGLAGFGMMQAWASRGDD
jgi:hypothetical protein